MSRPFPAKYPGRCAADCGQEIEVGDAVSYDEDDRVRHQNCGDVLPDKPEGSPCPSCWLVHAGECM